MLKSKQKIYIETCKIAQEFAIQCMEDVHEAIFHKFEEMNIKKTV